MNRGVAAHLLVHSLKKLFSLVSVLDVWLSRRQSRGLRRSLNLALDALSKFRVLEKWFDRLLLLLDVDLLIPLSGFSCRLDFTLALGIFLWAWCLFTEEFSLGGNWISGLWVWSLVSGHWVKYGMSKAEGGVSDKAVETFIGEATQTKDVVLKRVVLWIIYLWLVMIYLAVRFRKEPKLKATHILTALEMIGKPTGLILKSDELIYHVHGVDCEFIECWGGKVVVVEDISLVIVEIPLGFLVLLGFGLLLTHHLV